MTISVRKKILNFIGTSVVFTLQSALTLAIFFGMSILLILIFSIVLGVVFGVKFTS